MSDIEVHSKSYCGDSNDIKYYHDFTKTTDLETCINTIHAGMQEASGHDHAQIDGMNCCSDSKFYHDTINGWCGCCEQGSTYIDSTDSMPGLTLYTFKYKTVNDGFEEERDC